MIEWLQEWYKQQCNEDWEHEYGIIIRTIDNPGWSVEIGLKNTKLENLSIPYTLTEKSENDWMGFSVKDNTFIGAGDSGKLSAIIELFKSINMKYG
jgi:Immunity protein 53